MSYKQIEKLLLVLVGVVLFSGCIKDEFDAPNEGHAVVLDGSVTLNINMPTPLPKQINTRSDATAFDELRDLNIVIADGTSDASRVLSCLYFDVRNQANNTSIVNGPDNELVVYTKDENGENGSPVYNIHFSKLWLEYMRIPAESTFFLVGNYGSALSRNTVTTVGTLRSLKQASPAGLDGSVARPSVFFGNSVADDSRPITHPDDNTTGKALKIEMKRTVAMITVMIDGSGLNPNISIEPMEISLHNVPTWCMLGRDNLITTTDNKLTPQAGAVAEKGDARVAAELNWGTIVGNTSAVGGTGIYAGLKDMPTECGKHYCTTDPNTGVTSAPDYSMTDVHPLFMFENYHGSSFGESSNTDQRWKRPAGVSQDVTKIEEATTSCSYLAIKAKYRRYDKDGLVVCGGNVTFKVLLGADIIKDFDVMRNTYYRFTLSLKGNAVTEGGQINANGDLLLTVNEDALTWRVNSDLSKIMIIGDAERMFGGPGEIMCIEFTQGSLSQQNYKAEFMNENGTEISASEVKYKDFLFVESANENSGSSDWFTVTDVYNNFKSFKNPVTGHYEMYFYVQPMIRNVTWTESGHMRQIKFRITQNGRDAYSDWITVTQYEPCEVTIDNNSPAAVQDYAKTHFKQLPVTLWIDRVDRNAMAWGFSDIELAENQSTGFENVYHLIDPLQYTNGDVHYLHKQEAMNYLPFGTSYRERVGNGVLLNYDKGSCMMHSAFIDSFQKWQYPDEMTKQGVRTVDIIGRTALPARPSGNGPLTFAWSIASFREWQLLEMMLQEDADLLDRQFPLVPWINYWTSDHESGTANSYVYQIGEGLELLPEGELPAGRLESRDKKLRYRLIATKPANLN